MSDDPKTYRSAAWFGKHDKDGFIHRSWMRNQGLPDDVFDGRPVIGICNTWSELTPCNAHLRDIAEHVKRGVWEAGGLPVEFPVMSTGESNMRPTAMLFRNLVSMDVEESIRANPIDGVVLLCGCDKTTPSLVMGAASCDVPGDRRLGRPDAERQVPRPGHRLGHRRLEVQRGRQGRDDEPRAVHATPRRACPARPATAWSWARRRRWRRWWRRWAWRCRTTPRCRPSIRAATRSPTWPAAASSTLVKEDVRISKILTRAAFENAIRVNGAHRRLDQRRHPPARHRRPRRRAADAGRLGHVSAATCRRWSISSRRAGS